MRYPVITCSVRGILCTVALMSVSACARHEATLPQQLRLLTASYPPKAGDVTLYPRKIDVKPDVSCITGDGDTLYACTNTSAGIEVFESTNSGATWVRTAQLTTHSTIWRTSVSWTINPGGMLARDHVLVRPDAVDYDLIRSIDGGRNWSPLGISELLGDDLGSVDHHSVLVVGDELYAWINGKLRIKPLRAKEWSSIEAPPLDGARRNVKSPLTAAASPNRVEIFADHGHLHLVSEGAIYRLTSESPTWQLVGRPQTPLPDFPWLSAPGVLLGARSGQVLRSSDDGLTWERAIGSLAKSHAACEPRSLTAFRGSLFAVVVCIDVPTEDARARVSGFSRGVSNAHFTLHRSADGRVWEQIEVPMSEPESLYAFGEHLYVAGDGLIRSPDGGDWTEVDHFFASESVERLWATDTELLAGSASFPGDVTPPRWVAVGIDGLDKRWQTLHPSDLEFVGTTVTTGDSVFARGYPADVLQFRTSNHTWSHPLGSLKDSVVGLASLGRSVVVLTSDGLFRLPDRPGKHEKIAPPIPGCDYVTAMGASTRFVVVSCGDVPFKIRDPATVPVDNYSLFATVPHSNAWHQLSHTRHVVRFASSPSVVIGVDIAGDLLVFTSADHWDAISPVGLDTSLSPGPLYLRSDTSLDLSDLWVDPDWPSFMLAANSTGLFWSADSGRNFHRAQTASGSSNEAALGVTSLVKFQGQLLGSTPEGIVAIVDEVDRVGPITGALNQFEAFRQRHADSLAFQTGQWVCGLLAIWIGYLCALLMVATRKGSLVFGRSALIQFAAQPLLMIPGLARPLLFVGYRRRLSEVKEISDAVREPYFGLPARGPAREILPDDSGAALHAAIAEAAGTQRPVVLFGRGGAGKTRVLGRLASLALAGKLPLPLGKLRPIFVPAVYYDADSKEKDGRLTRAIALALRERSGVAVDEQSVVRQLEVGGFLVLFDGVSEVTQGNPDVALAEIIRAASHADYAANRFVISSRPATQHCEDAQVFNLRPLTAEAISLLLPMLHLSVESQATVRQSMEYFGGRPLEPLLFRMLTTQTDLEWKDRGRSGLYERYFRRLLRVPGEQQYQDWLGWRAILELLAQWSMLDTGQRGLGLLHEQILDALALPHSKDSSESFYQRWQRLYQTPVEHEFGLLKALSRHGILDAGRRWRFAHDTFEEYFAASRMVTLLTGGSAPELSKWKTAERQQSFAGVIEFFSELADAEVLTAFLRLAVPPLWRQILNRQKTEA